MRPEPRVCNIPKGYRIGHRCKKHACLNTFGRFVINCRPRLCVEVGFVLHLPSALICLSIVFKIVMRKHPAFFFNQSGSRQVIMSWFTGTFPRFAAEISFPTFGTGVTFSRA